MSQSIRLHPTHGVNPTIPVCFWCSKDKNEVALLGAAYKGEAPMRMVLDYDPCDDCKNIFDQGVVCIEVTDTAPDGRAPMSRHAQRLAYPTGRYAVIKADAVERIFNNPNVRAMVQKFRQCLLEATAFTALFIDDSDPQHPAKEADMQSKYVFDDQLELTTPVEVTLHDPAGRETVVSGFVSARYLERADIYDVTVPNERNQHGETKVLRNVSVGRLKIVGEPVAFRLRLASYHVPGMSN